METTTQHPSNAFTTIEELASYLKHKCRVRKDVCGISFEPMPGTLDRRYDIQKFFFNHRDQYGIPVGGRLWPFHSNVALLF